MIIRLTDLIKSFSNNGYDNFDDRNSMFLCQHVFYILTDAGVQTTRKKSSEEFYRQWGNKVRGLTEHMERGIKIQYNILEEWNAGTRFSALAFTCEFLNEGVAYNPFINGKQYRTWVLGHVLEHFGDIQFEFSEGV